MKKDEDFQTAEEFMAELENDPEFVRRRAEKAERRRRLEQHYERLEKPILQRLSALGFHGASIDEVVVRYAPLPDPVVRVFLESLETCDDRRQCEELVRAVATAENSFDGSALANCYDRITDDEAVRWVILNTIALTNPHSIDEWLRRARQIPYVRKTIDEEGSP